MNCRRELPNDKVIATQEAMLWKYLPAGRLKLVL